MGNPISRREFAALAFGAAVVGCGGALRLRATVSGGRVALARAALETAVVEGKAVLVALPEPSDAVVLIPLKDGDFRALSSRCTHLGCAVRPSTRFLQCPCHASTFDLNGNVLRGPAQKPLTRYEVVANDETIEIVLFS